MEQETLKKRRKSTVKEKHYEDYSSYVVTYLVLKLLNNKKIVDFNIRSDDEDFGYFDDVIVLVKNANKTEEKYAIQLKHFSNKNTRLTLEQLQEEKGNFSIKKYFKSFQKLKKKYSDYHFVLWTNQKLDAVKTIKLEDDEVEVELKKYEPHSLLKISESTNCYRFEVLNDKIEKIECYKTFFRCFSLYTNQMNFDQLITEIPKCMMKMFPCKKSITDEFLKFVIDWNSLEGEKDTLRKSIVRQKIALLLLDDRMYSFPSTDGSTSENAKLLQKAISKFEITVFDREVLDKVKKIWADYVQQLDSPKDINKFYKRYQLSYRNIFDVKDLTDVERTKLLWLMDKCPIIVEDDTTTREVIKLCKDKKFVLIGSSFNCEELSNLSIFKTLADLKTHGPIFDKITEKFLLSIPREYSLKELIVEGLDCESITTSDLLKMVEKPHVISQEKEILPETFVKRHLSKIKIDIKYLHTINDKKTLVVISNLTNNELFKNFNLISVNKYLNESESTDEKFLKIEETRNVLVSNDVCSQQDFLKIQQKNKNVKEVHHFKYESGKLEWLNSVGDISNLDRYRQEDDEYIPEEMVYTTDLHNKVNIIVANPGMGKSVFLKSLKNNLISSYWTVLVTPDDIHNFSLTKDLKNMATFENFILKTKFSKLTNLDKKILKLLMHKGEVVFLWDALDKLTDVKRKVAEELILAFFQKVNLQWVTARSRVKNLLQHTFGVLSRTVLPFNEEEQLYYINERLSRLKLGDGTKKVTDLITKNVSSASYIDILGIPLQIFTITELFLQHYKKLLGELFSLTDLYQYFVDEKLNLYFKQKCESSTNYHHLQFILQCFKEKYEENYQKAALNALFDDKIVNQIDCDCNDFLKKIREEGDEVGLIINISKDNLRPEFVHNSYTEYFAASYLLENYRKVPILQNLIFDRKYTNVRFFFDLLSSKNCTAHKAVLCNNFEKLLANEVSLNCKDLLGRNPLHLLCSWGKRYPLLEVTKMYDKKEGEYYQISDHDNYVVEKETEQYKNMLSCLLTACGLNEKDHVFQMNCLMYAEKCECLFTVAYIESQQKMEYLRGKPNSFICNIFYYGVRFGYDFIIDICGEINYVIDLNGNSFLHLAAKNNRHKYVQNLVLQEKYKLKINSRNKYGETPLHLTCSNGHVTTVDLLIKSGGDVNATNNNGWTPLHIASNSGHDATVDLLIKSGGNVNAYNIRRSTPLHNASANGHNATVDLLIKSGGDVNATTILGSTALHLASANGHDATIDLLIKSSGDVNARNKNGWTPLHQASNNGHDATVDLLIKSGGNVNASSNNGLTPLDNALANGHYDTVDLLVKSGGDVNSSSKRGSTLLHKTSARGHNATVDLLIKSGGDVNATTMLGSTPLHEASANGHDATVDLLIKSGGDINKTDYLGWTPLHKASANGHNATVNLLIKLGGDVNAGDKTGLTPLHEAAARGLNATVDLLIKLGGDVNKTDNNGRTPLHEATARGHNATVDLLIKSGGDVNATTMLGSTPLQLAEAYCHDATVDLLVKSGGDYFKRGPLKKTSETGHDVTVTKVEGNVRATRKKEHITRHCDIA